MNHDEKILNQFNGTTMREETFILKISVSYLLGSMLPGNKTENLEYFSSGSLLNQ